MWPAFVLAAFLLFMFVHWLSSSRMPMRKLLLKIDRLNSQVQDLEIERSQLMDRVRQRRRAGRVQDETVDQFIDAEIRAFNTKLGRIKAKTEELASYADAVRSSENERIDQLLNEACYVQQQRRKRRRVYRRMLRKEPHTYNTQLLYFVDCSDFAHALDLKSRASKLRFRLKDSMALFVAAEARAGRILDIPLAVLASDLPPDVDPRPEADDASTSPVLARQQPQPVIARPKKGCENCRLLLNNAEKVGTDPVALLWAVQAVLECRHQGPSKGRKDKHHERALDTLVNSMTPGWLSAPVSKALTNFKPQHRKVIARMLSDRGKWEEVRVLLDTFNATRRLALSDSLSMADYLLWAGQMSQSQDQKLEMMTCMLNHGCPPPTISDKATRAVVRGLLDSREDYVLVALLEGGVHPLALCAQQNPKLFSPVHFALEHCLRSPEAEFSLFDCLRSLRPSENKDTNGNTFLHLTLKAPPTATVCAALSHLISSGLADFHWNDQEQMAVDFFSSPKDRRIEMMIQEYLKKITGLKAPDLRDALMNQNRWFRMGELTQAEEEPDEMEEEPREGPIVQPAGTNRTNVPPPGRPATTAPEPVAPLPADRIETEASEMTDDKPWTAIYEKEALKLLMSKRCTKETRKRVFDIVNKLVSRERRPKDGRILWHPGKVHFYEANITKKQRLIWNIEMDSSETKIGIIRIWDVVLDHDKLARAVRRAVMRLKRLKGVERFEVYLHKVRMVAERGVVGGFRLNEEGVPQLLQPPEAAAGDWDDDFQPLKFCTLTTERYLDLIKLEAADMEFPTDVGEDEREVIHMAEEAPVLLLGRSGTGKTTCCLYRMWNTFKSYWTHLHTDHNRPWLPLKVGGSPCPGGRGEKQQVTAHLYQLFVTKNGVLCKQVARHFRRLCRGNPVTRKLHGREEFEEQEESAPNRLQDANVPKFCLPLILTSRQLWLALDASLPPSYFPRRPDGSLLHASSYTDTAIGGSGSSFVGTNRLQASALTEEWFHEELQQSLVAETEKQGPETTTGSSWPRQGRRLVTFDLFCQEVWPVCGTSKFHPSVLWTEIVSSIKGSYEAMQTSKGHLSLEAYLRLGREKAYISIADREEVYAMFLKFREYLKRNRMYDEMDFIFNLYKRLKLVKGGCLPWLIHQVYVDETQDFTQAELYLLMRLTASPNKMFLAGDTAQSVSRGVTFRFKDLKTLFYHAGLQMPVQLQLSHNYRSHNGILRLASSVLDLLADLFPTSFDKLQPDHGDQEGPKPELLPPSSPAELVSLLRISQRHAEPIEFGAHQVILLVNEEARNRLPREMRKANRLTIYESKGLEFDDVIIYNFFTDSQATKEDWRVILSGDNSWKGPRPKPFDADRHKILCSELKLLYTAVTRARSNVFFFDQDEEKRAAMFHYFRSRGLVQAEETSVSKRLTSFAPKASSSQTWERQGDRFFENGNFLPAANCYQNSGADTKFSIAVAYSRLQLASTSEDGKQLIYRQAALLFLEAYRKAKNSKERPEMQFHLAVKGAALCLAKAGNVVMAARILGRFKQFGKASSLYAKSGCKAEAQRCLTAAILAGGQQKVK